MNLWAHKKNQLKATISGKYQENKEYLYAEQEKIRKYVVKRIY